MKVKAGTIEFIMAGEKAVDARRNCAPRRATTSGENNLFTHVQ
jgi:hypothetical protein